MKMSSKTEYALKTLADLAFQDKETVTRIADIAHRQDIPVKFLEQILLILKSAGLVSSRRGAKGGYSLALPPSKITLASVVNLTDDYLLSKPIRETREKQDKAKRPFEEVWTDMNNYILQKLQKTTLQTICDRIEELQNTKSMNYFI
jgi:Rrf2 family protein